MGCIYYSSTNHWITSMNYNETSSVVDILRETKKHQCKVVAVSGLKKHVLAVFVWCSSTLRFGRCWGSSAPQWGRKKITPSSKSLPQYHSLVILISNLLVCFSDGCPAAALQVSPLASPPLHEKLWGFRPVELNYHLEIRKWLNCLNLWITSQQKLKALIFSSGGNCIFLLSANLTCILRVSIPFNSLPKCWLTSHPNMSKTDPSDTPTFWWYLFG